METAVLAMARKGQSQPRLRDGEADAGRTIDSQITPKTLLRYVNYGYSFHLISGRRHGILIRILPVFQSISFIVRQVYVLRSLCFKK